MVKLLQKSCRGFVLGGLSVLLLLVPPNLSAMNVPNGPFSRGRIHYSIHQDLLNFGFESGSIHQADQAWKAQGLAQQASFWNDQDATDRVLRGEHIDGPGNEWAYAHQPCPGDSSVCEMVFDYDEQWNTTDDPRPTSSEEPWLDSIGVTVHEFGHWIGSGHSQDRPMSDGSAWPTMYSCIDFDPDFLCDPDASINGNGIYYWARTIQADEANAIRTARPTSPSNIVANGSFEYDVTPGWGGLEGMGWFYRQASSGSGTADQYCDDPAPAFHLACFVEFNGGGHANASVYQDIFNYGGNWIEQENRKLYPVVWVRNRAPGNETATVVVWAGDTGDILTSESRSIAPNDWEEFRLPAFRNPSNNIRMRFEVYNGSANYNMDVDHANIRICEVGSSQFPC